MQQLNLRLRQYGLVARPDRRTDVYQSLSYCGELVPSVFCLSHQVLGLIDGDGELEKRTNVGLNDKVGID